MLYSWLSSLSLSGMAWIIFLTIVLQGISIAAEKKIVLYIAGIGNGFSDFYYNIINSNDRNHHAFICPFPYTGTDSILRVNLPGRAFTKISIFLS
jgi:hypothetical protein